MCEYTVYLTFIKSKADVVYKKKLQFPKRGDFHRIFVKIYEDLKSSIFINFH